MTPSREMSNKDKPCTNGDFESVADKGELRTKGYEELLLKLRGSDFIFSLNRVASVTKFLFNVISRIFLCDAYLKFKGGYGTHDTNYSFSWRETLHIRYMHPLSTQIT